LQFLFEMSRIRLAEITAIRSGKRRKARRMPEFLSPECSKGDGSEKETEERQQDPQGRKKSHMSEAQCNDQEFLERIRVLPANSNRANTLKKRQGNAKMLQRIQNRKRNLSIRCFSLWENHYVSGEKSLSGVKSKDIMGKLCAKETAGQLVELIFRMFPLRPAGAERNISPALHRESCDRNFRTI